MSIKRLWEYFFDRWTATIEREGKETWCKTYANTGYEKPNSDFVRYYVIYKYTNKFDGSEKLVKKYLE